MPIDENVNLIDLDTEIHNIEHAVYGKDVRGSIATAFSKVSRAESGVIQTAVNEYLDGHSPQFTESYTKEEIDTMVDGLESDISNVSNVANSKINFDDLDYVTPEMFYTPSNNPNALPDYASAINTAISTAISENKEFKILGEKEYRITHPIVININNDDNEYFRPAFDFNGALIFADFEGTRAVHYNNPPASSGVDRHSPHSKCGIKNLVIKGATVSVSENNSTEKINCGVYINYSKGAIFENINIYNCKKGIYMQNSGESVIRNCTVQREKSLDIIDSGIAEDSSSDPKLTATSTDYVGFDLVGDDMFIEDCVAIDYIVGIRLKGGDNKVSGCHPWNTSLSQLKYACCFLTNGNNYFVNNTCDRFHIGIYCRLNTAGVFTNTLFTNQAYSNDDDDITSDNYCWYLDPTTSGKSNGGIIKAVNTRVNGNIEHANRNLKWCNIQAFNIDDVNTVGYAVDRYFTKDIKGVRRAKIDLVNGSITINSRFAEESYSDAPTTSGNTNGGYRAQNITIDNGTIDSKHAHVFSGSSSGSSGQHYISVDPGHIDSNKKYLLCFRYKSNIETTLPCVKYFTKVDGSPNVTLPKDNSLFNSGSSSTGYLNPTTSGTYCNIFTFPSIENGTNVVTIGSDSSRQYGDGFSEFIIWDLCLYELPTIPRYLFENEWAYAKRLVAFCDYQRPYTGPNLDSSITIPVIDDAISFKSLKCRMHIDKSANTTESDHDYYHVGYDNSGRPIIKSKSRTNYDTDKRYVYSKIYFNKLSAIVDFAVTDAITRAGGGSIDYSPFAVAENGDEPSRYFTNKSTTQSIVLKGTSNNNSYIRLAVRPYDGGGSGDDTSVIKVSSFRFDDGLYMDDPIVERGEFIDEFEDGEIYLVYKGYTPTDTTYPPTVMYELNSSIYQNTHLENLESIISDLTSRIEALESQEA